MGTDSQQLGWGQKFFLFFVIAFTVTMMLAGAALVLGAPWAAWVGFQTLSKEVQVAVGAAVITVVGSVASLILTNQVNRQKELEQELRKKKEPVYEELLEFCFKLNSGHAETMTEAEMEQFLNSFSQKLLLWGSDDVVKAYIDTRKAIGASSDPNQIMLSFEQMFRAIRSDFGHKNKNLQQGDLSTFLITRRDLPEDEKPQNELPA